MTHWLQKRASLSPGRLALLGQEEAWTFAELHTRAIRTARRLRHAGIHPGDRLALLCQNGLQMVELIHAAEYAGAVLVLLNTRLTPYELSWQLEDSEAKLLIFDAANLQKAAAILEGRPNAAGMAGDELMALPEADADLDTEVDLESTHTIIYTSGTTGHPKGVLLSYGNHWWSAVGSALNLGLHADDRWLLCLPMFHVSGLSILMRSVIYGMAVVVHETFDPAQVNRCIQSEGVTIVSVVSNMLARLLDNLGAQRYPESFRCMLLGGGPVPLPLLEDCKKRGVPVVQTYGLTETASQIVTLGPEYMISKLGSAGKPLFPAELQILRDGRPVAAGEAGDIAVKGPNVTKGYYRRDAATAAAIQNGWLYTGDLGWMDEEGFLYVLDRRSDLIISGGENVYPAEIESVLLGHPAVEEAGVTGKTSEQWEQVPVAFVKLRSGMEASSEELLDYCRQRLARYKIPAAIYFADRLPRNASNKLLRRKLAEWLEPSC